MSEERLTIDKIVEHCKRMTKKFEKYNKMDSLENNDMDTGMMKEYWEHRQTAEYLEELKQYRDLEEQGLLLRLPCKVGDTFWELNENAEQPYAYPRIAHSLQHCVYALEGLGKTTFLMQSEAEEKLRELDGKWNREQRGARE